MRAARVVCGSGDKLGESRGAVFDPVAEGNRSDLAATTRRGPGPWERQRAVLPLGEDRLAQNNFDPLRADRGALDRVSHILLGRLIPSQPTSLFSGFAGA